MRGSKASTAVRITAGVMGLMMLAAALFSAFCIAAEADHDCCGDGCPVCACIRQWRDTLRGLSGALRALRAVSVPVLPLLLAAAVSGAACTVRTPVSVKVRLND